MSKVSSAVLLETLDKIVSTPILVTGDLMLDRYLWGRVDRISPEAPVPVVEVRRTEDRLGGAANMVRNLVALGVQVRVAGVVGADDEGTTIRDQLTASGARCDLVLVDPSRPTVLKTRVVAQTQQIVRIDRESRLEAPPEITARLAAQLDSAIADSKAVVVSDYGKGTVTAGILAVLHSAVQRGELRLGRRPLVVDPHPRNFSAYKAMTVVKPNRKEAEAAAGRLITSTRDAFLVAEILAQRWGSEMVVITMGEDGMVVKMADTTEGIHLKTTAKEVLDVSGAGDTVTAVFAAALAVGSSATVAGILSNLAAGLVVSEAGTAAVRAERLRAEVLQWGAEAAEGGRECRP